VPVLLITCKSTLQSTIIKFFIYINPIPQPQAKLLPAKPIVVEKCRDPKRPTCPRITTQASNPKTDQPQLPKRSRRLYTPFVGQKTRNARPITICGLSTRASLSRRYPPPKVLDDPKFGTTACLVEFQCSTIPRRTGPFMVGDTRLGKGGKVERGWAQVLPLGCSGHTNFLSSMRPHVLNTGFYFFSRQIQFLLIKLFLHALSSFLNLKQTSARFTHWQGKTRSVVQPFSWQPVSEPPRESYKHIVCPIELLPPSNQCNLVSCRIQPKRNFQLGCVGLA
jgi:hypothetical protein